MDIESLIGYMAACLTTISFLPQVIRVVLTKRTEDISRNMYILLNLGVCLWLSYGIMKSDLPIILANGITLIFSFTILVFKLREKKQ
ncbi:MAG: SemiSWEET family sugar transporter [Leptospiraceae bacterium]|nr:SemiSWEET family sugar transporter [Leptospiraceae bacterium]